jgi:hypothetical protein
MESTRNNHNIWQYGNIVIVVVVIKDDLMLNVSEFVSIHISMNHFKMSRQCLILKCIWNIEYFLNYGYNAVLFCHQHFSVFLSFFFDPFRECSSKEQLRMNERHSLIICELFLILEELSSGDFN